MGFDLISEKQPIARKEHICQWCGEKILKGEKYCRYTGTYDSDFQDTSMHLECHKAMQEDYKQTGEDFFEPFGYKRGTIEQK